MGKKIVAFGASNSKASINRQLATFAANQVKGGIINLLDLNDFEMPIYGIDREQTEGIPQLAHDFKQHIKDANGIIISFAEHNGAYSAAFKNIMDWISRMEGTTWEEKPMLLLATSPGGRGASTVLDIAVNKFKFMNKATQSSFSLPFFTKNFNNEEGITDAELLAQFRAALAIFEDAI